MPKPFLSIRTKLLLLVAAAILLAQSIVAGTTVWREANRYIAMRRDILNATGQAIAASAAPAAANGDADGVYKSLRAIGTLAGIVHARVERPDGRLIADAGATEQLGSDLVVQDSSNEISVFDALASRTVQLSTPVIEGGVRVGTLTLVGDVSDLPNRLYAALATTALGALAAIMIALALALRLQSRMTRPLSELTRAMSRIGSSHDYAVMIETKSRDEIGLLVNGFNSMIEDIKDRDQKLVRHMAQLESDVADRTAD